MLNFNNVTFKRFIIHTIIAKEPAQSCASVDFDEDITTVTPEIEEIIKKRLVKSCGRRSKAFTLDIADTSAESFFNYAVQLATADEPAFIHLTKSIALKLASAQRRNIISGGDLLIIDAINDDGKPTVIVIKAEPHDGVSNKKSGGKSKLELIKQIILSPNDKFYKMAAVYPAEDPEKTYPNDSYTGLIFDDQFRSNSKPAEYFWKEFLGFSMDGNGKLQSKRFYDEVKSFISEKYKQDTERKTTLLENLRSYLLHGPSPVIDSTYFGDTYIDEEHADDYGRIVRNSFPHSFPKEIDLVRRRLERKLITFADEINIQAPANIFEERVSIITDRESLQRIDLEDNCTVIVIKGKPTMR